MTLLSKKYPLETGANNPILRKKNPPVAKVTKETKEFGKALLELMYEYEGAGLAAPQIGQNTRMIAVSFWKDDGKKLKRLGDAVMINPEIISKSDKMSVSEEACLSLPKQSGEVLRHDHIKLSRTDLNNKKHTQKFSDYDATIIQHEIDHLDGILFIDKLIN